MSLHSYGIKENYKTTEQPLTLKNQKIKSPEEQRQEKIKKYFDSSNIWTTKKIEIYDKLADTGENDTLELPSPYVTGMYGVRKAGIFFEMTPEEQEEYNRCKDDPVYFSEKYCYTMTDKGLANVTLRPYQRKIIQKYNDNRFCIFLASRQTGKTVTSSFYIIWYSLFHSQRNILVVANKAATMVEIINKMQEVYIHLPFFLKKGVRKFIGSSIVFEDKTRIFGQATSPTPALGFAIHLLYIDEFAHIRPNIAEPFYRSVYPTISSSEISKIIVTSTANGKNLFYELYAGAVSGKNEYVPIRVDWYEVPGRGEEWKQKQIANLGSERLFNQEFGNQFITEDKSFLNPVSSTFLHKINKKFGWRSIDTLERLDSNPNELIWHPELDLNSLKNNFFVLSFDFADGIGLDYSVMNIFRLETMSKSKIQKITNSINLLDFFRFRQIGIFRTKDHGIEDFSNISTNIIKELFDIQKLKIVVEVNDLRGAFLISQIETHELYEDYVFLKTLHNVNSHTKKVGVRLNRVNKKLFFSEIRKRVNLRNFIIEEEETLKEFENLGLNTKGNFIVQLGNDDAVMTCMNIGACYIEEDFSGFLYSVFDESRSEYRKLIDDRIDLNGDSVGGGDLSAVFL